MIKPSNFENVKSNINGYETLNLGGHECVVVQATETKTMNGDEMLVVLLDTSPTDKQPNFYKKKYDNDTRPNKKWGCTVRLFNNENEYSKQFMANFIDAICNANNMTREQIDWANITKQLKGKKIVTVFREEEFQKEDGTIILLTVPYAFRTVEALKEGRIKVPQVRKLKNTSSNSNDIFGGDITPVDDGNMPF